MLYLCSYCYYPQDSDEKEIFMGLMEADSKEQAEELFRVACTKAYTTPGYYINVAPVGSVMRLD